VAEDGPLLGSSSFLVRKKLTPPAKPKNPTKPKKKP